MGIIVIMLAALLPAVRGLSTSASRRGAVGTLLGALDRARMMAVSDGLATYVVFAVPTGDGSQLRKDLWGRAYAIYEDHDNISFTPEQRTPWMQMPQGMALKINSNGTQFTSVTNRVLQAGSDPAFPITSGALATAGAAASVRLPYWKFDSTGQVDEQTSVYLRMLIFPGLIDASGNEVSTQNTGGNGSTSQMILEEIDINSATGRAKYIINPINNLATPTPTPST